MEAEKVKLSKLADDIIVSYEGASEKEIYTVKELKDAIIKYGEPHHETEGWGIVLEQKKWKPNAQLMLDDYIKNEQLEMYKGWGDRAWRYLDETVVAEIQKILDESFKFSFESVIDYCTFSKAVVIDIIPPYYEKTFKNLNNKYGYDRAVLIYHGMSVDEVLAYSDEDAEAAVEALNGI
ncbi:hypothetical protein [Lysinibacillus fusiformis]|uniref:hypothetical protein n=1 Tax=Lysinibacillus fusiformis TaxID=28031 RepID=UPI00187E3020|nr:hypothetical protein [Lysinibacillus fusiformis]MBD8523872.1 hypothetical protein [Lysinibacillus fusiformis]